LFFKLNFFLNNFIFFSSLGVKLFEDWTEYNFNWSLFYFFKKFIYYNQLIFLNSYKIYILIFFLWFIIIFFINY
jgi:small-conductance mechanosensitive channel